MAALRDWPRTLQPASYKGTAFFVDRDTVETGRRLVVHEFPLKDVPYVEDLGRDTNKINVTAYVVSDNADGEEKALRGVCERGGAGRLSLPMETFQAHCESCSRDFAKDKLGLVAFNLKFIREGAGGGAGFGLPAGFFAAQIGVSALGLVSAASTAFLGQFQTIGLSSVVQAAGALGIQQAASVIGSIAGGIGIAPDFGPGVFRTLADIARNADSLARVGNAGPSLSQTSFRAERAQATSGDLVASLRQAMDGLRLGVEPVRGATALAEIAAYEALPPAAEARAPTRRRIAANDEVLARTVRLVALAGYAEAIAARPFRDRIEAIQVRANAAELYTAEMMRIAPGPGSADLHRALLEVSARVAEYVSGRVADLAPVIIAESGVMMPSLWWSNRLYGAGAVSAPGAPSKNIADRAAELVTRNRVIHGSFMPTRIEALGS